MLICHKCKTTYESGSYCADCGAKLSEINGNNCCANCGLQFEKIPKFCPNCGQKTEGANDANSCPKCGEMADTINWKFCSRCGAVNPQFTATSLLPTASDDLLENTIKTAAKDGIITEDEYNLIEMVRIEKGIPKSRAKELVNVYLSEANKAEDVSQIAIPKLIELANSGNISAITSLFERYSSGEGVPQDNFKAFEYAKRAYRAGIPEFRPLLIEGYFFGVGTDVNYEEAYQLAQDGFSKNDVRSLEWLAHMQMRGLGCKTDYESAFKNLNIAIESGDFTSLTSSNLGLLFFYGHGVSKDIDRAYNYFKHAIELNDKNDDAYFYLGEISLNKNTLSSTRDAIGYLEKGHEIGDTSCTCSLGDIYFLGLNVVQDYEKAYDIFKSIVDDHDYAKMRLGEYFLYGFEPVRQNIDMALDLLNEASAKGIGRASMLLASLHLIYRSNPNDALRSAILAKEQEVSSEMIIANLIEDFAIFHSDDSSVYAQANIPKKKLEKSEFAQMALNEGLTIHLFFDDTLFGSGKDGFVLTNDCILALDLLIMYSEINSVAKTKTNELVINGNKLQMTTATSELIDNFKNLFEVLRKV